MESCANALKLLVAENNNEKETVASYVTNSVEITESQNNAVYL
jgi:hypothetical protein